MDGQRQGSPTLRWGLRVLKWDFLITFPETLALGMLTFPSLYQDRRLEALTPEEWRVGNS